MSEWSNPPEGFAQSSAAAAGWKDPPQPRRHSSVADDGPRVGTRVDGCVRVRAASAEGAMGILCEELSRELAEACSKPPELTELTEAPAFAKALEVAAAKVKKVKVDRQVLEEQLHEKDLELLEAERELRLKRSEDASREARLRYKLGLDGDTGAIPEHKIYDVVMMPATGQRPTSAERVMSNSSSPLMSPRRSSVPSSPRSSTPQSPRGRGSDQSSSRGSYTRRIRENPHAAVLLEVHTRLLSTSGASFSYVSGRRQCDHDLPWVGIGRDERDFDADRHAVANSLRKVTDEVTRQAVERAREERIYGARAAKDAASLTMPLPPSSLAVANPSSPTSRPASPTTAVLIADTKLGRNPKTAGRVNEYRAGSAAGSGAGYVEPPRVTTAGTNSLPNASRIDADEEEAATRDSLHYGTSRVGLFFNKTGPQRLDVQQAHLMAQGAKGGGELWAQVPGRDHASRVDNYVGQPAGSVRTTQQQAAEWRDSMQKVESEARVSRLEALTESFMREEEKHEAVRAAEAAREKVARSEQLLSRKPRAGL